MSNAGNLRAWCLRELRLPDDPAAVERALSRRRVPEHGLTVLPFWSAERAPTWEENQRGVIDGISLNTSALDLLQAVTEASYFRIARIADLLAKDAAGPLELIVSGGIQRSRASLQRLANVLGAPLHPNDEPEATLRGAAVATLEKLGLPVLLKPLRRGIRPDPQAAEWYARERERQHGLKTVGYRWFRRGVTGDHPSLPGLPGRTNLRILLSWSAAEGPSGWRQPSAASDSTSPLPSTFASGGGRSFGLARHVSG